MRSYEFIIEGREGYLYHGMELDKAINVFKNDMIPAMWEHNIPGIGRIKGNSFTRNKLLRWGFVKLTVDQQKLAQNNKIIPLDADYVHLQKFNKSEKPIPWNAKISDRNQISPHTWFKKTPEEFLQEEFVIGDIKNLHIKLVQIELRLDTKFTHNLGMYPKDNLLELPNMLKNMLINIITHLLLTKG
jgi:hypothetical protein